jgi:hypothetical protein
VVGGDTVVGLTWEAPEDPLPIALFGSLSPTTVYEGSPFEVDPPGTRLQLSGLPNGTPLWFGLAVDEGDGWEPLGAVLSATPGPPIYVDAQADPAVADGQTPATAYPSLFSALLLASFAPSNVWVTGDAYGGSALPVFPGTRLYGGFAAGFALDERDPLAHPTEIGGIPNQPVLTVQGGAPGVILDGLVIDATGAPAGVEITETPFALAGLVVRDGASRGVRLQGAETGDPVDGLLVGCELEGNAAEGLFGQGAWSLEVHGCDISGNGQEGFDLDDLVAPDGRTVRLTVRRSRFASNGSDGADVDLAAPLFGGTSGARFEILFESCRFELNAANGLLLDVDYELVPGWRSELVLRGCTARGNLGHGLLFDLDGESTTFVHRLLSTGNAADGLRVTSETLPVLATVSASVLTGNGGDGLAATDGQATMLLSHGVLAGNAAGGLRSPLVDAAAVSTCAWRQPLPWPGSLAHFVAVSDDPLAPLFQRAPADYTRALAFDGVTLGLPAGGPGFLPGDLVELADDDVERSATTPAGTSLVVDPAPAALLLPALVTRFAGGAGVTEDWSVLPGSAADGAGMPPPAAPPIDAGPLSAPLGGAPGVEELVPEPLFHAGALAPPPSQPLPPGNSIQVSFVGGPVKASSVSAATVRVLGPSGDPLAAPVFEQDGDAVIAPPSGMWPSGELILELHVGLESQDGVPLATPLAIPWTVP